MYVNLIEHFAYTERTILLNLKLLDTDLKIILLDYKNNFVGNLKNNERCCKKFLYFSNQFEHYFDNLTKLFSFLLILY